MNFSTQCFKLLLLTDLTSSSKISDLTKMTIFFLNFDQNDENVG